MPEMFINVVNIENEAHMTYLSQLRIYSPSNVD
jgi:hypothetical protein